MSDDLIPSEPVKLWVLKVQTQHRVRIGKEIANWVNWLKPEKGFGTECVARLGPLQQVQFLPKEREMLALEKLKYSLRAVPARADDVSTAWLDFARFAASGWKVTVKFESENGRFTFALPEAPRQLGILPSEGEHIVVFGTGEILETWRAPEWVRHISNLSANLKIRTNLAMEELESRGED